MKKLKLYFSIFFIGLSFLSFGQKCNFLLEGKLVDSQSLEPIPFAALLIVGSGQGIMTEPDGTFHFHDRCPGKQSIIISHIAYYPDTINFIINADTNITIKLESKAEWLKGVDVVEDYHAHDQRYIGGSIEQKSVSIQSNKNLGDMLESIEGVDVLKTGTGTSKPIIHGMYGNRVTTVNRGITQSGQQWGNDHGPEIDAFGAQKISVIKGAGVLAYDGNSLGNIIIIKSADIATDSNLHGEVNTIFQSNGLGLTLNASLEKTSKWAAWRLTASLKKIGDNYTPDYYLTNTGKTELNFSGQLNKTIKNKWFNELYFSVFNTNIGILRGSHIGNISDLEEAIGREEPFFTEDHFSYEINPPRQNVQHYLAKYEAKYFTKPYSFFSLKYAWQVDNRLEYDVRRGDRSDIPALSLNLITNSIDASYVHHFHTGFTLTNGYQYNSLDNTNDPETGVLPLIPDYYSWSNSLYSILEKDKDRWGFDIGIRYNYRIFNVATISRTVPREVVRYNNDYSNFAFSGSLKYVWSPGWTAKFNANMAQRSPDINELYSNGLHQGVAAIEEGNPDLDSETSFKALLSIDGERIKNLHFQFVVYIQKVDNYIFLEANNEYRLTIRGAYPVYVYNQTNALLYGNDFSIDYLISDRFDVEFRYAIVRGRDLNVNDYLINIPPDRLKLNFNYHFKENKKWGKAQIGIKSQYTFKQIRVNPEQDYMAPPAAYFLLGLSGDVTRFYSKSNLGLNLRIDNILNTSYRDYLNRWRYFSDDIGINIQLGLRWTF